MKRFSVAAVVLACVLVYAAPLLRSQTSGLTQLQQPSPVTAENPVTVPGTIAPPAPGAPGQSAIAVTSVPSPASPQNPTDQVMWALAMSYILKFVTRKQWFSFLTPATSSRIKTICGFLTAAGTAAGIHMAVNGSFFSAGGVGVTLTGLSADAFKDIGFQWVSQQGWYDFVVKERKA